MSIRILLTAVGIVLLLANPGWAQSTTTSTTTFDSLSPGNQKIANALFSAQNTTGTTLPPLTKDQIAGLKGSEGWGRVFKQMKADGLLQAKNLGQVVGGSQHQLNAARRGSGGTTAGTASAATIARANRSGDPTMADSARIHNRVGDAGFGRERGVAGGSHFGMGHGVAVSTMGSGGFGHGGMGGGFGGGHGGGGGGGGGGRGR